MATLGTATTPLHVNKLLRLAEELVFSFDGDAAGRKAAWRALEVAIVPGITAMLAVAARVGAPLGHDFCAVSLSDNLKPWPVIERRLDAAAQAGFVIALYNPVSQARPWQLATAFERLRGHLPATTPTVTPSPRTTAKATVKKTSPTSAAG